MKIIKKDQRLEDFDFNKIKTLDSNIIYDGLYSASIGYFDELK